MGWEIFHGRSDGQSAPSRRFVPETEAEKAERKAFEERVRQQRIDAICEGLKGHGVLGQGR